MSDSNGQVNINFGWFGLLGVILVVGKLTGHIQISWFWATMPFWLGLVIVLGILAIAGLGIGGLYGVGAIMDKLHERKRRKAREERAREMAKFQATQMYK